MPRSRSNENDTEESITSGTGPAYAVAGYGAADTNGVHCSAFNEFCFFCTYQKNADAVGSEADLYGNLVEMAENLATLKREPPAIAHHISTAYKSTVQHYVPDKPNWSVASILRHLLYSNTFETMFEDGVTSMFTSLIARQNSALVDTTSGQVIEDNRYVYL
jgi:hypothetical protein